MNLTLLMVMSTKQYECHFQFAAFGTFSGIKKGQRIGHPVLRINLQKLRLSFLLVHLCLFFVFFIKQRIDNNGTRCITSDVERGTNHIEDTVKSEQQW